MITREVLVNKKPYKVRVSERNGNVFLVKVNGKAAKVKIKNPSQGEKALIEINGRPLHAEVNRIERTILHIKIGGKTFEVQRRPKISEETNVKVEPPATIKKKPAPSPATQKDLLTAPIAGRIALLKAIARQKVEKGDCICVLEAMKMENEIAAPKTGVVREIRVSEGAIVNKGDVLAVIT